MDLPAVSPPPYYYNLSKTSKWPSCYHHINSKNYIKITTSSITFSVHASTSIKKMDSKATTKDSLPPVSKPQLVAISISQVSGGSKSKP